MESVELVSADSETSGANFDAATKKLTLYGLRGPAGQSITDVVVDTSTSYTSPSATLSPGGLLTLYGLQGPQGISITSVVVEPGTGTPSARFDTTTGVLTLSGLKGEKGDSGDSAGSITQYNCAFVSKSETTWTVNSSSGSPFPASYYVGLQIRVVYESDDKTVILNGKIESTSSGSIVFSLISSTGIIPSKDGAITTSKCQLNSVQSGAASGFLFGAGKSLSRTGVAYWGPGSNFSTTASNNAEDASVPMPSGGTLSNLFVAVTAAPGGYVFEFKVLVNRIKSDDTYESTFEETESKLSCTITLTAKSCRNNSASIPIFAGDRVVIEVRQTSSSNSGTNPPLMQFSLTLAP